MPTWEQVGVSDKILEYIKQAVLLEWNMIISGATNTGKTTLLKMIMAFIDANRRVIGVEDTPELDLSNSGIVSVCLLRVKPAPVPVF